MVFIRLPAYAQWLTKGINSGTIMLSIQLSDQQTVTNSDRILFTFND